MANKRVVIHDMNSESSDTTIIAVNDVRLVAGAQDEVDDDLDKILEDLERKEETQINEAKRKRERRSFIPTPTIEPGKKLTKNEKCQLFMEYFKMTLLVSISVLSTILLAMAPTYVKHSHSIAVSPGILKAYEIEDAQSIGRDVGVTLQGPFLAQDKLKGGGNAPSLKVYIQRSSGNEDDNRETISKVWEIFILDPEIAKTAERELKKYTFKLNVREPGKDGTVYVALETLNMEEPVQMVIEVNNAPIDQKQGITFGVFVLIFLYSMIVSEIVDRTLASIVAAAFSLGALAYFNARPSIDTIIQWIDVETLVLLVGMMILVSIFSESGIFDYLSVFSYRIAKGRAWPLINCLCFFTAFLAAFLDSVTMMLLVTPVTIRLCEITSLNPVPILICMVVFANVGAALTPVGDPPNVIISLNPFIQANNVNFGNFCLHMAPCVVWAILSTYAHVRVLYRKPDSLKPKESKEREEIKQEIAVWEKAATAIAAATKDEDLVRQTILAKVERLKQKLAMTEGSQGPEPTFEETLAELTAQYKIRNKPLLIKALIVFLFVLVLFFLHAVPDMPHLSLGWSALVGALLLIIIADIRDLEAVLEHVEWSTLLFFAALFIVMECLSELGLIQLIGDWCVSMIQDVEPKHRLTVALMIVIWVSGIASAFLDNIPVTTMMVKIVITLSQNKELGLPLHPLVWALALGACFGGNGTLIGASANVVTAGISEQHGYKITFMQYFIVCFPIMLNTLVVASVYLLIAHVALTWH